MLSFYFFSTLMCISPKGTISVLLIHEVVETCSKVRLKPVFHPLLEDEFKHFSRLARVFTGQDVALRQCLHLADA